MSTIALASKEKSGLLDTALLVFIGPFSVSCTIALALQQRGNLDLSLLCLAAVFFCIKLPRRGLFYSILLLVLSAACKHLFFMNHHFWQFGIELSACLGFAITALSSEQLQEREMALRAQMSGKEQTLRNLEEEIEKSKETALQENLSLQEKLTSLQKEFEETVAELDSVQVLSNVLRKASAKQSLVEETLFQKDQELFALQQELAKLKEAMAPDEEQIASLRKELNSARLQREQTHLVNETLARLVSIQSKKAERVDAKEEELQKALADFAQLNAENLEITDQKERLEELTMHLEGELRACAHFRGQVEERGQMIEHLEERLKSLSHVQALYLQLKSQFDDKNEVLHQTRVELFRTDTALMGAQREQELQSSAPAFSEQLLAQDLNVLEKENTALEEENGALTELVTQLVHERAQMSFIPDEAPRKLPVPKKTVKKKAKKKKSGPDQRLLF
jgi:hypothetical protein